MTITPHETIKRAIEASQTIKDYAAKAYYLNDQDQVEGNIVKAHKMLSALAGSTGYEAKIDDAYIAIADLHALLDVQMMSAEEWIPIDQYDYINFPEVELAAYIIPSEAAQANGARPFWDFGYGRCWHVNTRKFTGIMGGSPSHFRLMRERTPPIAATLTGKDEK